MRRLTAAILPILCAPAITLAQTDGRSPMRVATFNVENLTRDANQQRLATLAQFVRRIGADVILINEVDTPPDDLHAGIDPLIDLVNEDMPEGRRYTAVVRPTNTGVHSGHDLNNDGTLDEEPGSRAYGNDCLGFGEYPGQYGMALLVRAPFRVDEANVRTFADFLWKDMPNAKLPRTTDGEPWYTDEELAVLPLPSKTMMDVPVIAPNGTAVRMICAHPTPPVFDGPEDRNGRRNHDEIRLIADYLAGETYLTDDSGNGSPFPKDAHSVILGDMNADPDEGDTLGNPIELLLRHPRVQRLPAPRAEHRVEPAQKLDPDDTSEFGLRVDYVLPSRGLLWIGSSLPRILSDIPPKGGELRRIPHQDETPVPSDHDPVILDLVVPDSTGE